MRWAPRVAADWEKSPLVFEVEFARAYLIDTLRLALSFKMTQGSALPSYAVTVATCNNHNAWTEAVTGAASSRAQVKRHKTHPHALTNRTPTLTCDKDTPLTCHI